MAERKHRTILEIAISLRFQDILIIRFWGEYVASAIYILNRLPSKFVGYKSPFEMMYLHPPLLSHVRVFGCLCYAICPQVLDNFLIPDVFLGYSSTQKGYLLYTLHSKTLIVNMNVVFQENNFSLKACYTYKRSCIPYPRLAVSIDTSSNQLPADSSRRAPHSTTSSEEDVSMIPYVTDQLHDISQNALMFYQQVNEPPIEHKRLFRPNKPHLWLQDNVSTSKGSKFTYPISSYVHYSSIDPSYKQDLASYSALLKPTSFKKAAADPKWIATMKLEIAALEDNNTLCIVDLPPGKTLISCQWV